MPQVEVHRRLVDQIERTAHGVTVGPDPNWSAAGVLLMSRDAIIDLAAKLDTLYGETYALRMRVGELEDKYEPGQHGAADEGEDAPAAPAAAKHRHDYRDAHGAESDTCLTCGKKKNPNGRKRKQTLIPPPAPAPAAPAANGAAAPE